MNWRRRSRPFRVRDDLLLRKWIPQCRKFLPTQSYWRRRQPISIHTTTSFYLRPIRSSYLPYVMLLKSSTRRIHNIGKSETFVLRIRETCSFFLSFKYWCLWIVKLVNAGWSRLDFHELALVLYSLSSRCISHILRSFLSPSWSFPNNSIRTYLKFIGLV